jgi:hypothetical protein
MWQQEAWDRYLPEEMKREMGSALEALSLFASRSVAEEVAAESTRADVSMERLGETSCRVFSDAVLEHASMGGHL